MRLFLALVSGFAVTLGVFVAGAGLATAYLVGPKQERDGMDMTAGWTSEPVRVAYAPVEPQVQDTAFRNEVPKLALVATANAIESAGEPTDPERQRAAEADALAAAHLDWCNDRYRSYRIEDNTYRPYGGGREFCISPYLEEMEATAQAQPVGDGDIIEAAFQGDSYEFGSTEAPAMDDVMTREHIRSCLDRYRSYRPQDNSYQPYGGGPRRQCL